MTRVGESIASTRAMTEEELDREHAALMAEQAELESAHQKLEESPKDVRAHLVHAERLHAHIKRLHAYMEARGYHVPSSGATMKAHHG